MKPNYNKVGGGLRRIPWYYCFVVTAVMRLNCTSISLPRQECLAPCKVVLHHKWLSSLTWTHPNFAVGYDFCFWMSSCCTKGTLFLKTGQPNIGIFLLQGTQTANTHCLAATASHLQKASLHSVRVHCTWLVEIQKHGRKAPCSWSFLSSAFTSSSVAEYRLIQRL